VKLVSIPANPVPEGATLAMIRTPDGVSLRTVRWPPPPGRKGTVCLFQGRTECIEKYFEMVRELRGRGFAVATLDWRGQGLSDRALRDRFKGHVENFAQYDSPSPFVKALGEDGARAYLAKNRRLITSQHTYAALDRPDLSYPGKLTGPPKIAVVSFVQIAPGRNMEYENLIKTDVLPAMKKADVLAYSVSQTVLGGDANEYVGVTVLDKFADLDKGNPLLRALGQDGFNKYLQKTAGIIVHQERIVARFRADLSFMPEPMAEKK